MTLFYNGFLVLLLTLIIPLSQPDYQGDRPVISAPQEGQALQGQVTITGSSNVIGFRTYEVLFTYDTAAKPTWFLIKQSDKAVDNGTLAVWDTTTITDGNYKIMLRVSTEDGTPVEVTVSGLRVRNYSPIETDSPATQVVETTPGAQSSSVPGVTQAATSLAPNPAEVTVSTLMVNVLKGIGIGVLLLIVIGVILFFLSKPRHARRRRTQPRSGEHKE
jgi:hypothetical protein